MEDIITTGVCVVGAGPVGLSTALELGRRGIPCLLIDQGEGVIDHPRGTGVSVRTMEYFRRWGLADEIRRGYSGTLPLNQIFCSSMSGYEFAIARYPTLDDTPLPPTSPEHVQRCSQNWWDATIAGAVKRQPSVELRYETRYEHLESNGGQGVTAVVTDLRTGTTARVHCRYLVACDGVNSRIRQELGLIREGDTVVDYRMSILFHVEDLIGKLGREPGERFIILVPDGARGNVTSIDGHDVWRLLVRGMGDRFDLDTFDPAAYVRAALGRDDIDFTVRSVMPWRNARWVASRYRVGNVFLAGDSAHSMPPSGGFGANTGISDAMNLSWKLVANLQGWGGEPLLDSYEHERKPTAQRNAAYATTNTLNWTPDGPLAAAFDDTPESAAIRAELGEQLIAATRAEWESLGVSLGYRYSDSPICVPDGTPEPTDDPIVYVPTSRPGSRAPHAWLDDGRSTLDLFLDSFTLVRLRDDADVEPLVDTAGRRGIPLDVVDIRQDDIAQLYDRALILVRPDGHVAWRSDTVDLDADKLLDIVCGAGSGDRPGVARVVEDVDTRNPGG